MDPAFLFRLANFGRLTRERMIRDGCNTRGDKLWTDEESAVIRLLYPDYGAVRRELPHRSLHAVQAQAQKLRLCKQIKVWTGADIARLRQLYPCGDPKEICDA